jgi:tRNA-splicing ligase RtcB
MHNAKDLMKKMFISLPDPELAYLAEGTKEFTNYINDVMWCQEFSRENREEMMRRVIKDISFAVYGEDGKINKLMEVNCHHNYLDRENHYGENVIITRKGAVRARVGDLGIIPGSMGAKSFIVRGLGNPESFHSCSHGAGRRMSRGEAKRKFTLDDLSAQTAGVECRKDAGVLDEIPSAYKDIDEVMANQSDLVEIVAQLKQIMCIKG